MRSSPNSTIDRHRWTRYRSSGPLGTTIAAAIFARYGRHLAGAWRWIAVGLLGFHFLAPFCFLLFRPIKRNPQFLVAIAAIIFLAHIVELWWMLAPSIYQNGFHVSWIAPAAFLAVGGVWLTIFLKSLEAKPLLPLNDPRFAVAVPP